MNTERLLAQGKLAELKKKFKDKDLSASALLTTARTLLNPYEEDLTLIDIDKALVTVKLLQKTISEMKELKEQIRHLEEALNG